MEMRLSDWSAETSSAADDGPCGHDPTADSGRTGLFKLQQQQAQPADTGASLLAQQPVSSSSSTSLAAVPVSSSCRDVGSNEVRQLCKKRQLWIVVACQSSQPLVTPATTARQATSASVGGSMHDCSQGIESNPPCKPDGAAPKIILQTMKSENGHGSCVVIKHEASDAGINVAGRA